MNIQHTRRQNGKSNQHDVRIPVLLVPSEIVFHQSTQGLTIASNKQVLTIYNPFSYALDFRVLSTVPKYVGEPVYEDL